MIQAPNHTTDWLVSWPHAMTDLKPPYALLAFSLTKVMRGLHNRRDIWNRIASKVSSWQLKGFGSWRVDLCHAGEFIGQIGVNQPGDPSELEVGWIFLATIKEKGLAHGADTAVLHCVQNSLKPATPVSYVLPQNHWSIAMEQHLCATYNPHAEVPKGKTIGETSAYCRAKCAVSWR